MLNLNILDNIVGKCVERPNKVGHGTLSGHAAGEPFEKLVYNTLKTEYPSSIYKQFEYLNDLYLRHPKCITIEDRNALIASPTVLFLLSRGNNATIKWTPDNLFEEKQNDTADILFHSKGDGFGIIDVKTRNMGKNAQPPNIISAYKLAQACTYIIDNDDNVSNINIYYIGIDWRECGDKLECVDCEIRELFKVPPERLYINWAAAMQIQFHIQTLDQSYNGTLVEWSRAYLRVFVESAKLRCQKMLDSYVKPFEKYIN